MEALFNWIEIRAVGWQQPHERTDRFEVGTHVGMLVDGEIVEHDDIARPQARREDLLDVGQEARLIDRAIKDGGRGEPAESQPHDERVRFPMAARGVITESRAARASAIAAEQIGRYAAFVEEDILAHVAQRLPGTPALARDHDVRPALFVGVYGFF